MVIVVDARVLIAALRSSRGASSMLLGLVGTGRFEIALSAPLVLVYEGVATRQADELGIPLEAVGDILDYLCAVALQRRVHYLWRPTLQDPKDDMVLEIAVASAASRIVTFNKRDFHGAELFGIRVLTPREFLQEVGELP